MASKEKSNATLRVCAYIGDAKTLLAWNLLDKKRAKNLAGFTVQVQRQANGAYLPEVEKLLALGGPAAVGNAATGHFRWYDNPNGQTPNPLEAFSGFGTVQVTRQNTGNDQIAGYTVTITGQGRRTQITNPSTSTSGALPVASTALPSGAAAGALVTITGSGFSGVTGAAGVKFRGTNATNYTVVNGSTIVATVPTGSAGSAPIVVTHPTNGASAALPYTRA